MRKSASLTAIANERRALLTMKTRDKKSKTKSRSRPAVCVECLPIAARQHKPISLILRKSETHEAETVKSNKITKPVDRMNNSVTARFHSRLGKHREEEEDTQFAINQLAIRASLQQKLNPRNREATEQQTVPGKIKPVEITQNVASPNTHPQVLGLASAGQALAPRERAYFERRFGTAFSQVQIHNNSQAAGAARSLNARAFTIGNNIAFTNGQYAPHTIAGRKLLAHELTHTIQQSKGDNGVIRRDLATPLPAVAPPRRRALTKAEIRRAIRYNRRRYNVVGTRLIQDLVGTRPTGKWTRVDIIAIASIQEQYGLRKDGRVGFRTFRFLDREVRNERLRRSDTNCLTDLHINQFPQLIVPRNNGALMEGNFQMRTQFSRYCACRNFQYRQFIRGHFTLQRGRGLRRRIFDQGTWFHRLPGGRLNATWQEDGDTSIPANYGHRNRAATNINQYVNDRGRPDMRNGCRFRGVDNPGGNYRGWGGVVPRSGDIIDIRLRFRGEIRRNARVVRRKWWTGLRRRFVLPP